MSVGEEARFLVVAQVDVRVVQVVDLLEDLAHAVQAAGGRRVQVAHALHVLGCLREQEQVALALLLLQAEVRLGLQLAWLVELGKLVLQRGYLGLDRVGDRR